ncbi:ABC transporter substrate-binding protein [Bradyrhizobium sp. NAS96.2]|uniref:ABC transporter substrate-binding protein n=1 Tax=Bradyrhizobium sp. NAS96.2 TaxID=1680160 RepID=UPI00143CF25F|nr:ABC transporter substrate-binding protein [Bradyrhizobium sp. NAS96.2]
MNNAVSKVSRRSFLGGAASALAAPMVIRASRAAPNSNSLTFTGYGGSLQEIQIKTVMNPFTEETGIKVNIIPAPDLARVKAQLLTGNVELDVFEGQSALTASGSKQGFWEKLDLSMFDLEDMAVKPTSDAVPYLLFAGGIAWDPKRFGPGKHPANFSEYFDLVKFPGRRTFSNHPDATLEMALLADGVSPKDIYPLDLDRAFKALDRVKPSVAAWVNTTTQAVSLAQTGEVDFTYVAASNRIKATNEPGGGVPLAFSFEQNVLGSETLTVLKGAPNKQNAIKFIAYFLRPDVQARLMTALGLVPISKKAVPMLPAETRKWQPDLKNPQSVFIDAAYWADHLDAVSVRFKEWILS